MSRLKLGIVGCGDIAGFTALVSRLVPQVALAACCDLNAERAERLAKRHRIRYVYTGYAEMLAEADLEAVYLAVPHHLHADMMRAAIRAGKHIFVEKPITCNLTQGKQVTALAAENGIKIGVNYQYRYDRGCYALARAVQGGDLGQVYFCRGNLPWHREKDYFENAPWHSSQKEACGGTLITQGSHILDVMLWAVGSRPLAVTAVIAQKKFTNVEVEDLALGAVELENGALLQISSSMAATPEQPIVVEVYGEKGTAIYQNRPRPHVRFVGIRAKKERPPFWGVHALQRSLTGFAQWVLDGRPYLTPGEVALPVLAVVEAMYRSAETGKREYVEI